MAKDTECVLLQVLAQEGSRMTLTSYIVPVTHPVVGDEGFLKKFQNADTDLTAYTPKRNPTAHEIHEVLHGLEDCPSHTYDSDDDGGVGPMKIPDGVRITAVYLRHELLA